MEILKEVKEIFKMSDLCLMTSSIGLVRKNAHSLKCYCSLKIKAPIFCNIRLNSQHVELLLKNSLCSDFTRDFIKGLYRSLREILGNRQNILKSRLNFPNISTFQQWLRSALACAIFLGEQKFFPLVWRTYSGGFHLLREQNICYYI